VGEGPVVLDGEGAETGRPGRPGRGRAGRDNRMELPEKAGKKTGWAAETDEP
jgi:hypothetical protein